jgi:hypothetical protein
MSMKTIAKFLVFVIFLAGTALVLAGCSTAISNEPGRTGSSGRALFQKPIVVGKIESKEVIESSGIAASKCQPGVYWTHNDSGDGPNIYAFNEKGENLGTFRVSNAENDDWEDIAEYKDPLGKCFIYIGDIGDNKIRRPLRAIFRVAEPVIADSTRKTDSKSAVPTEPSIALNFRYPNQQRNSETMMVDPGTGDIYVLTKSIERGSEVFKLKGNFGSEDISVAQKIADIVMPNVPNGQLTGGDISPNGKRVVLCDYSWAYELELPVNTKNFDEIWAVKPDKIDFGRLPQAEAIGYTADGLAIVATSESKNPPIVMVKRNQ